MAGVGGVPPCSYGVCVRTGRVWLFFMIEVVTAGELLLASLRILGMCVIRYVLYIFPALCGFGDKRPSCDHIKYAWCVYIAYFFAVYGSCSGSKCFLKPYKSFYAACCKD